MVKKESMKQTEQESHGLKFLNILMKIQNYTQKDTTKQQCKRFSNFSTVHTVNKNN